MAAGVISWEYATTNWNEEAIKVAVALNGIGPFISLSFRNKFLKSFRFNRPGCRFSGCIEMGLLQVGFFMSPDDLDKIYLLCFKIAEKVYIQTRNARR